MTRKQKTHKDQTDKLIEAIRNKDLESIKKIKDDIGRERWLNRFDGSVPPEAWLMENPFVEFEETQTPASLPANATEPSSANR